MSDIDNLQIQSEIPTQYSELNEDQIVTLFCVANRRSPTYIAEKLDTSYATVNRILNGLTGEKQEVDKYNTENIYVRKLNKNGNNTLNYELNDAGKQVIGGLNVDDLPSFSDNPEEDDSSVEKSDKAWSSDWKIRPHYLTATFKYRSRPDGWEYLNEDDFASVFYDYEEEFEGTEEVKKELPNGKTVYGRRFFYKGHKIELYENTVVVRIDYGTEGSRVPVNKMWRQFREDLDMIVNRIESRFRPVRLRSRPENIESSMSTQHWAKLEDAFAEMVSQDEGLQDDEEGLLWMVRNERDEPVAMIDRSHGEVEFEWVHGQEAKNHMNNMKDLIRWGSYYEITPKDFRDLEWLRENIEMFESIIDRLDVLEGLQDTVSELSGSVESNDEALSVLQDEMDNVREELRGLDSRVESNSDDIVDVNERVDDVVGRVDKNSKRSNFLDRKIDNLEEDVSESLRNRDELVQSNIEILSEEIHEVTSVQSSIVTGYRFNAKTNNILSDELKELKSEKNELTEELVDVRENNSEMLDELKEIKREQKKSWSEKAFEKSKKVAESFKEKIRGLF